MFRKTAQIVTSVIFALCLFASFADTAQAANATPSCVALNRNWVCGVPGANASVPVTQCIETVQGGAVTSRADRSFASATALSFFLNNPPTGSIYQPCNTAPACVATTEDKTVACPAGQTGSIVQRRTVNTGNVCGVTSAYTEISNTCRAVPTCTETTETQTLACPAGQTGQITQSRQVNVGNVCGSNSAFTETGNTCRIPPVLTCTFNGQTIQNGGTVTAYSTATVAYGQVCMSETRTCTNGVLSGSYTQTSCTVTPPLTCTFNGQVIQNGGTVTAYKETSVGYNKTCESETRTCANGVLSGSYTQTSCTVTPPRICTSFPGKQLNSGESITAYRTRSVPFGEICESETRTCTDGTLSGSFTFETCNPDGAKTCTFNGQTIANGATVTAYETTTVGYNQVCKSETRTCTNGNLSGSYTAAACTPDTPKTCTFNGQVIPNGGTVTAFQASTVTGTSATAGDAHAETSGGQCVSEVRTCTNGNLSGSYMYATCNQTCGAGTESRTSTPCPAGQEGTVTETRTTNINGQCGVNSEWAVSSSTCRPVCTAGTTRAANGDCIGNTCTFNGQTLQSGQTVTAYKKVGQTDSIPGSYICQSETRTCKNGNLTGSYTDATCNDYVPPATCTFNGQTVQNGATVTAYQTASMPYGQVCKSETRTCNNGSLSGSYTYSNCSNQQASCSINLQAGNYLNLNVLQLAQQQKCPIVEGVTVNLTILGGANVGSNDVGYPAFTTGTGWPANVTIKVVNYGRIQGAGGDGAYVEQNSGNMVPAQAGGPAISAPYPMTFDNSNGQIWGGGGGGATIGFGHCSPAGGGGAGILPGETFDPWGSCDANGNVVAANNNSGRITRNGKNTDYLATAVTPADNEYMIRSIGADANAAYYVSGPGGLPGQAGGNAHYYIRSPYGQPYGTPADTITGYYFYPTFPSSVLNVTGGDAGLAIDKPQNVSFTNSATGDRRGRDYPTVPPRAPTPRPPLEATCASTTETRDVACPAGQQANQNGKIVESRTYNANGTCGSTTEWTQTSNTCRAANSCTFNGQTIGDGQTVTAYQSASAPYGGTCNYEQRVCHDGTLSGSFGATSCTVAPPATCTFNGQVIQNGQSVTAYQSGSVGYGQQCMSEQRACQNGQLSGSYGTSNCAIAPPATCTFNGQVIQNGQSITAYQSHTVGYGQQCISEQRTCNNGVLSGSYITSSCTPGQPASCMGPDGRTIPSGSSVTYYSQGSMGENQACQGEMRTCNNGLLYGSYGSATCTQTMCTYAQAGDAIARACSTTTYNGGVMTGSSTSNTQMPATSTSNSNSNSNSTSNSSSNGTTNNNSSSSSSQSSSASNATGGSSNVTINNSGNSQNSNANSVVAH